MNRPAQPNTRVKAEGALVGIQQRLEALRISSLVCANCRLAPQERRRKWRAGHDPRYHACRVPNESRPYRTKGQCEEALRSSKPMSCAKLAAVVSCARRPPLVFLREAFPVTLCRHGYLFPVSRDHENRRVQFIRTWKVSLLAACVQCRLPEEALPLAGIVSGSERSDVPAGIWQTIGIEPMVILMTLSHPAALEAFRQPPFKSIAPIPFFSVMWAALADVKRRDVPQSAHVCHFCT